jgi:hypothetical protein
MLAGCGSSDEGGGSADGTGGVAADGGDGSGGIVGSGGSVDPGTGGGGGATGGTAGQPGTGGSATGGATVGDAGPEAGADGCGTFDIRIDYQFDTQQAFTAERRAAIEWAADFWACSIDDEFDDVPALTALRTRHPEHLDEPGMVFTVDYDIDDLVIFVAFTAIDGPSMTLAESSHSFTFQVIDQALLATLQARYDLNPFQPWVGNTGYDQEEAWFYDPTPETDEDIPGDNSDFISTALHEIGHLLGVGSAAVWEGLVENGEFVGEHAMAVNGGPVLLDADGVHIDRSVLSEGRRNLMDAGTPRGTRKLPTELDRAILEDLGYTFRP